jgi:hypothetical protein
VRCEDVRLDIEAYALGALEEREKLAVESHLETCEDCREIERAYRTAVDHLSLAIPLYRAPPRLRDRIMGGIGASRPILTPRSILHMRWWAGTAAAALLFIAIGGLAWAVTLSFEVRGLREDNQRLVELSELDTEQRTALLALQGDLNQARNEQKRMVTTIEEQATLLLVALDPELVPTELQGTQLAPQARCYYVWSRQQGLGALSCKDLPATSIGLSYQLWVTKGDKTIAAGAFVPRPNGIAQLLVKFPADAPGPVNNLWVTLEQSSATTRPSNQVILVEAPEQQAAR